MAVGPISFGSPDHAARSPADGDRGPAIRLCDAPSPRDRDGMWGTVSPGATAGVAGREGVGSVAGGNPVDDAGSRGVGSG
jgi:hypothetical protein